MDVLGKATSRPYSRVVVFHKRHKGEVTGQVVLYLRTNNDPFKELVTPKRGLRTLKSEAVLSVFGSNGPTKQLSIWCIVCFRMVVAAPFRESSLSSPGAPL